MEVHIKGFLGSVNHDWLVASLKERYPNAVSVDSFQALDEALRMAKDIQELSFIEVKCAIGARDDLGRPTTTPLDNKKNFMRFLNVEKSAGIQI